METNDNYGSFVAAVEFLNAVAASKAAKKKRTDEHKRRTSGNLQRASYCELRDRKYISSNWSEKSEP